MAEGGLKPCTNSETTTVADKGPSLNRVFHAPKLERKQSTGDLLSRLKTRKILGVGETENGDIHRSKISQLLGHNEHLYIRLPRGWWAFHVTMAACLTSEGLIYLAWPMQASKIFHATLELSQGITSGVNCYVAQRCHGAALLSLSIILWKNAYTSDRTEARISTAAMGLYHGLTFAISCIGASQIAAETEIPGTVWSRRFLCVLLGKMAMCTISALYYRWIGASTSGLRKSSSYKDLSGGTYSTGASQNTESKKEM